MILQTFFNTGYNTVPESLSPKDSSYFYLLGGVLFISFLFLALVKRSNHKVFVVLIQLFFNPSNIDQRMKDDLRMTSFASILLLINYLVIFSVCSFLFLNFIQVLPSLTNSWITFIVPLFLLLIQIGFVSIVNWISGADLPMSSIIGNTLIVLELTGVLLSILALFWLLNPEYSFLSAIVFLSLLGFAQVLRVLKNSFTVLNSGVGWYYILLYFCTLEILPLFVAYYYVQLNFIK